jgi:hypothetical protein
MRDLTDFRAGIPIPPPAPVDETIYDAFDVVYRTGVYAGPRLTGTWSTAKLALDMTKVAQVWGSIGDRVYLIA